MKKSGLVIILILAIAIIGFSSVTYAFYSSARAEFSFVVESEVGSSIGLNLYNSEKALKPANTSSEVGNYAAKDGATGESYAVFVIQYNATSALNLTFQITNVTYKDKAGNDFSAGYNAYLDKILAYSIKLETSLDTYHLADNETYNTTVLHNLSASDWKLKYDNTNATTQAATSYNFPSVAQGSGYMFCYIRFYDVDEDEPVSQEMILPAFDDMTISFTIASQLNNNNP